MGKMRSILVALTAVYVSATTAKASFFCPWADAIVKLDFGPDQTEVRLAYRLYPRTPTLRVESRPHPFLPDRWVLHFRDMDASYVYDFFFDPEMADLTNARINLKTGRRVEQRGYCFAADTVK